MKVPIRVLLQERRMYGFSELRNSYTKNEKYFYNKNALREGSRTYGFISLAHVCIRKI